MDSRKHFTIRQVLLATLAVAGLLAIPSHAGRISLPISLAIWGFPIYNALIVAAITYPIWWLLKRHPAVLAALAILYLLNFMPELVTAVDFSITGDNDTTGYWLAERGLDYDPLISIPCHFSVYENG